MKVLEGDKLKSKLTGMIYEVKKIEDKSVVLESKDGSNQEWTDMGNLRMRESIVRDTSQKTAMFHSLRVYGFNCERQNSGIKVLSSIVVLGD
jgi:hypothetical protein